jgi:P27 family predicted phage terminase small subunit
MSSKGTRGSKATLQAIDGGLKGVPKPPAEIPTGMADEWQTIAADMVKREILTAAMAGILSTYVIALWTARECQRAIAEHGPMVKSAHGMFKPNPANGMMAKAMDTVARLSAELGLTPAARSKQGFGAKDRPKSGGAPDGLDV